MDNGFNVFFSIRIFKGVGVDKNTGCKIYGSSRLVRRFRKKYTFRNSLNDTLFDTINAFFYTFLYDFHRAVCDFDVIREHFRVFNSAAAFTLSKVFE